MKEMHHLHRFSYRTGFLSQKIQWVLTTKTSWTVRVGVWLPGDHNDSILKLRALSLFLSLFLFLSHRTNNEVETREYNKGHLSSNN